MTPSEGFLLFRLVRFLGLAIEIIGIVWYASNRLSGYNVFVQTIVAFSGFTIFVVSVVLCKLLRRVV